MKNSTSLAVCKSFIRTHLDYESILYGKPNNENFQSKIEKVQHQACLTMTCGIQGTFGKNIFVELGLHSLVKELS